MKICSQGERRFRLLREKQESPSGDDSRSQKEIFEEHGYTLDCRGCDVSIVGLDRREHTRVCRTRLEECLAKIDKGRKVFEREKEIFKLKKEDANESDEFENEEDVADASVANIMNNHCQLLCNA